MPTSTTSSKYFFRELSLIRLYTVLLLSSLYFIIQLVVSHVAHSLILQVDAYHMLYNILALVTSIVTTKMCRKGASLKTTFGWTRLDVTGAVASLCFLAASCFSIVIESLQAMFHSTHHEAMTMPMTVLAVGCGGLLVNSLSYAIIGGYTQQQKSFLGSHKDGQDIIISPSARRGPSNPKLKCGGPLDILRDFLGCFLVVAVAATVYLWKSDSVSFVDPSVAIVEIFILGVLSYKYAKEAGYILLLTIPDNIDVESLMTELFETFPEISDIHEFHIWQLNPSRVIATAHVVLKSMDNCWIVQNNIVEFLEGKGITKVTIQPEFLELQGQVNVSGESPETLRKRQCFLPCSATEDCFEKKCCLTDEELSLLAEKEPSIGHHGHSHAGSGHNHSHSAGGGGHKAAWSWKNPLKRSTSSLINLPDESQHLHPPQNTHLHGDKSNPDLSREKESIVVDAKLINKSGAVQKPNLTTPVQHQDEFESSDEDDDNTVLKPMI